MNTVKRCRNILNKAITNVKNPYWRAKQRYIKYYDTLPIDEKTILIESQQGMSCNGNMFYLLQYLEQREEYADYRIYVSVREGARDSVQRLLNEHNIFRATIVILSTDEYFRILASAKYLFNDNTFLSFFIKKEGQIYTNTWHGTPLKTLGRKLESGKNAIGNVQKNFMTCDYLLVPNERTRDALVADYMVENLSSTEIVFSGYPRNTVFFDAGRQASIREKINPDGKRIYAYMPTFRGAADTGGTAKGNVYLQYYLYELDKQLSDGEILYVNLHPVAKKVLNFRQYKHIQEFPAFLETYEMLSICDCLITDYSSVFFDYAVSGRKIILFPYDIDEYMADRGTYTSMEELPFPKVYDIPHLLTELRSTKQYDDNSFLEQFSAYESKDATAALCRLVFFNQRNGIRIESTKNNGKENVLIFAGNLDKNGVTSSLKSLLCTIDTERRNYYITFKTSSGANSNQEYALQQFPQSVYYFAMTGDMNLTVYERIIRKLFKEGILHAPSYARLLKKRILQEKERCFGDARFKTMIHFCGYEKESILFFSLFHSKRIIYSHSDMQAEIRTRGNQRQDVLEYAYRNYDTVAVVTEDIIDSTSTFIGSRESIKVCRNLIDYQTIQANAQEEIAFDKNTKVFPNCVSFLEMMSSSKKKFISVGRFSPEKGHRRLISAFQRYRLQNPDSCLIIMGGNTWKDEYEKTVNHIKSLNMEDCVFLLLRVSNPFPIIKACDAFILSSYYEGFGLVLAEADILGLPVVSTDCTGPCSFMREHGGTLVENSEEGIYQGLCMLGNGTIKPMSINYAKYNQEAAAEFETLF